MVRSGADTEVDMVSGEANRKERAYFFPDTKFFVIQKSVVSAQEKADPPEKCPEPGASEIDGEVVVNGNELPESPYDFETNASLDPERIVPTIVLRFNSVTRLSRVPESVAERGTSILPDHTTNVPSSNS